MHILQSERPFVILPIKDSRSKDHRRCREGALSCPTFVLQVGAKLRAFEYTYAYHFIEYEYDGEPSCASEKKYLPKGPQAQWSGQGGLAHAPLTFSPRTTIPFLCQSYHVVTSAAAYRIVSPQRRRLERFASEP